MKLTTLHILIISAFILAPTTSLAAPPCATYDDCLKLYVPYVKYASASTLCPELPDESLGTWLEGEFGEGAEIEWEVNDCGERPEVIDPEADYPVCVGVYAVLPDGGDVYLNFIAGTEKKGPSGPVELFYGDVDSICDLPYYLGMPE
ncbi:MAG: hypothetical protein HZC51_03985 [Nitrospirae bacterium]|nr:hypothetical protein [Nitrospirota bacterium]